MVHTKSFGAPLGNENYINMHNAFTEVNNLPKYALTKRIFVKIVDKSGIAVSNANVEYQLYNYAEFYPIAVVPTNAKGLSQLETGLGDLLIWAYKGNEFGYRKISVSETDTLLLELSGEPEVNYSIDMDLNVPVIRPPLPVPSAQMVGQNAIRIAEENLTRQKYIDTWMNKQDAKLLSVKLGIDTGRTSVIISRSMGNYKEVSSFLAKTPDSLRKTALEMLEILPDKDLRDTKEKILSDHINKSLRVPWLSGVNGDALYLNYVLNPRIANEKLVAWRSYFLKEFVVQMISDFINDPLLIVKYLNENIKILNDANYYKTPLTPNGVIELKVSDSGSRSICFVAICRTLGIPSRLEPGSNVPQYFRNEKWNDIYFSDQVSPSQKKAFVRLITSETKPVPEYYTHFTIARFENGRYNTLEYDYNKKVTDFKEELELTPGNYMIVTGNRLIDSKILSNITFFNLSENEHKTIEIRLRKEVPNNIASGTIDLKKIIDLFYNKSCTNERLTSRGVAVFWIEPEKEPTKHIFNDLPILKTEFDSWGGYFLFLSGSPKDNETFRHENLKGLPANILFGVDSGMVVLKEIMKKVVPSEISFPYLIMADKNGNITFTSAGYRIGIGEQILKQIK